MNGAGDVGPGRILADATPALVVCAWCDKRDGVVRVFGVGPLVSHTICGFHAAEMYAELLAADWRERHA